MGLLSALQEEGLLDGGQYFVVGLFQGIWGEEHPATYLRGMLQVRAWIYYELFISYGNVLGSLLTPPPYPTPTH